MQWKPVVRFETRYEVSDTGIVRTIKNGHIKVPQILRYGHHAVLLWCGNKQNMIRVHRMVLEAFVGPCPAGMECRHIDGKSANNAVSNLAWGTSTENQRDRVRHGTSNRGERCAAAKLTTAQILAIRDDLRLQREIAADYGVGASQISRIKAKLRWSHIA